jgi:hypothetical protein
MDQKLLAFTAVRPTQIAGGAGDPAARISQ